MKRIPNTPHTLIHTGNRLAQLPILLAATIPQQFCLLPHALVLQVLDAYGPHRAVGISCDDDRVVHWSWGNREFNLRVIACEGGERGFYEGIHAAGGTPIIAVVEGEGFAGEDERTNAILDDVSVRV
jgi:hypothetical protein